MKLLEEMLVKLLRFENVTVVFPNLETEVKEILEGECYLALQKIKTIIEDDSLEDEECFMQIEKIVCVFEALGSHGGNRHDFG